MFVLLSTFCTIFDIVLGDNVGIVGGTVVGVSTVPGITRILGTDNGSPRAMILEGREGLKWNKLYCNGESVIWSHDNAIYSHMTRVSVT